jgi:hypothetical protein
MTASYFTRPEKPIKAIESRHDDTNRIGVPCMKAGIGLVLSLRRMPAKSSIERRKPSATPMA